MKKLLCCFMSLVLALGLMPAPALADEQGDGALAAAGVPPLLAQAGETTVSLPDANLYAAVKSELDKRGVSHVADDTTRTLTLDPANIASVTELDLMTRNIKSLTGLGAFTSLKKLVLSHNEIADIAPLSALTSLEYLDLYDNSVVDLDSLRGHTSLTHLDLGENSTSMAHLDVISTLANLTYLDYSENKTPTITDQVQNLTSLEFLQLQDNSIKDVSKLGGLVNMKTLILSHNSISGISALLPRTEGGEQLGMPHLEELNLHANALYAYQADVDSTGLAGAVVRDEAKNADAPAWPNLKKLAISGNTNWKMRSEGMAAKLFAMDQAGKIELAYNYDRIAGANGKDDEYNALCTRNTPLSSLPHVDAAGTLYVTYDDFGARCNGSYDDFNAVFNAHLYANANGCEVRATAGKTYHLFRYYNSTYYTAYTNVDWQGTTFIVHDEEIENKASRQVPMLCLRPSGAGKTESTSAFSDTVTIPNAQAMLAKDATSIAGMSDQVDVALAALRAKGYARFYVRVYNDNKKQYVRYGTNANGGKAQWDGFIVNAEGAIERNLVADGASSAYGAIQWDFDEVTRVIITPIPAEQSYVRNATFIYRPPASGTEAPYGRAGNKNSYYYRDLQLRDCANVKVSNVRQAVGTSGDYAQRGDGDALAGSYMAFLEVNSCADIELENCTAWARKYSQGGRSTYGLHANEVVNFKLARFDNSNPWEQLLDGQRWGIMGCNHAKHVVFDGCTVNRIDAHEGFYDMRASGCKLGSWGFRLIGQGPLLIEDSEVHASSFVMLRYDYGSTWDGTARIRNCTHYPRGTDSQGLFNLTPIYSDDAHTQVWNFGYDLRCPAIEVDGLTVSYSEFDGAKDEYYIVPNHTYNDMCSYPEAYWPANVNVKGLAFTNYREKIGHEPLFRLVSCEEGTVKGKLAGYAAAGVAYGGKALHQAIESGRILRGSDAGSLAITTAGGVDSTNRFALTFADLSGKELAVEYTGTRPLIACADSSNNWGGYVQFEPYYVQESNDRKIAYFSEALIRDRWNARNAGNASVGTLAKFRVITQDVNAKTVQAAGETTLYRIALLDAQTTEQTVSLGDASLYEAVVSQLAAKPGVSFLKGDDAQSVTLDVSQVTSLNLSNSYIASLDGLEKFTALTELDVSNNSIADLSPLSELSNLTTLKAYGNRVASVDAICSLTSLKHLELAKNELVDDKATSANCITSKLSNLVNLEHLDLGHCVIRYTSGLNALTNLTYLDLYDNAVHDFDGVRNMTWLAHLDLGENNEQGGGALTADNAHLDAIGTLAGLTYLDFSENASPAIVGEVGKIKTAQASLADGQPQLKFLQLQANGITDVTPLEGLAKLETLILAANSLKEGSTIAPLLGLTNLRELNLGGAMSSKTQGVDGMFDATGALVWPHLEKIDITCCWNHYSGTADKLIALDRAGEIQAAVDWNHTRSKYNNNLAEWEGKVRRDGATCYVCYDDFGARHDGTYDDYIAMVQTHSFANWWLVEHPEVSPANFEVRATAGCTYHVFNPYDTHRYEVKTNVNWMGATIVIHDEDIENKPARHTHLFCARTLDGGTAYANRVVLDAGATAAKDATRPFTFNFTVGASLKAGDKLPAALVEQFPAGFDRYIIEFYNADKKQHIRSGVNTNAGDDQYDGFIARADGTLEHDIQWDFDHLTKVAILPVPKDTGYLRDGNFVTCGIRSRSEVPYYRGNGKPIYYYRGFHLYQTANLEVSGMTHRLGAPDDYTQAWDELSGSYYGLFELAHASDVTVHDCRMYARKHTGTARSTYDIPWGYCVNLTFREMRDATGTDRDHRWSMISGHFGKNVLFDRCTTNSAGTHQTVYDFTVRDSEVCSVSLCGQGTALFENVTVRDSQQFVNLRSDYGTTWNGELRIVNCTHEYNGKNRPMLVNSQFDSNNWTEDAYGYPQRFPRLFVDNLKVDYAADQHAPGDWNYPNATYYAMYNSTNLSSPNKPEGAMAFVPAAYWPGDVVVNGVTFANAGGCGGTPVLQMTAADTGSIKDAERNYLQSDVRVLVAGGGGAQGEDITERLFSGEPVKATRSVTVSAGSAPGAASAYELVRTSSAGGEAKVASAAAGERLDYTASSSGDYELRVTSLTDAYSWEGSRTLRFSVAVDDGQQEGDGSNPGSGSGSSSSGSGSSTATHTHDWGDWQVVKLPTCTEAGEEERTCKSDPAHVEKRQIDALGHDWDDAYTVDVPATRESEGSESIHCKRCDATKEARSIPKFEDDPVAQTYAVTYHAAGGKGTMRADSVPAGQTVLVRSCAFTRSGYVFVGWSLARGAGVALKPGDELKVTADVDLYATWSTSPVVVRPVYRLARDKTGQRRYTVSTTKAISLARSGWRFEGLAFYAPAKGGMPVYQLKRSGRYVYTADVAEVRAFKKAGWKSKNTVFRALKSGGVPVYRLYSKKTGAYVLTKKKAEVKLLKKDGWKSQGKVLRAVR
ncbi:MAG: leucine-rich repeat domain-containing protein [Eggerthellaceae bacterium]|nr:leucine-rich repeat domain-containing protein [Eggerthellaceae bacterium]